jgi:hypothetical protein
MAHALSADRSAVSKSIATSFIAMESNFLLDIEKPGTRRPPARRSIFLHLQLLITQEKTRGGNCVSGNMSAPRMHIDVP